MTTSQAQGKWWLAAILLPLCAVGIGVVLALHAPYNKNDWLSIQFFVPVFYGLLAGCLLACVAATISMLKGERLAGVGVLAAILSLIFVIWSVGTRVAAARDLKRQAAYYEHWNTVSALRRQWRDKLRANPELITSDDFWRQQTDADGVAELGLFDLLQDNSFEMTLEIKECMVNNFPNDFLRLSYRRQFLTKADLESIVKNPKTGPWMRMFARRAIKEWTFQWNIDGVHRRFMSDSGLIAPNHMPGALPWDWKEFTVTKDAPFSDDRRHRLERVRKNGEVELIDCAASNEATKILVVKPELPEKKRRWTWLETAELIRNSRTLAGPMIEDELSSFQRMVRWLRYAVGLSQVVSESREEPVTIVVHASNFEKQTATIRELRIEAN